MADTPDLYQLWVYLSQTPLLWLTATLVAYVVGDAVSARCRRHPLANPVVIAAGLLIILLAVTGTPYPAYFEGAQFVHFLLGPATVALAVPLWRNRHRVLRNLAPMCAALVAGSLTAITSAAGIAGCSARRRRCWPRSPRNRRRRRSPWRSARRSAAFQRSPPCSSS